MAESRWRGDRPALLGVDGVQVVVDRDPADAHHLGDLLHRSPQEKRAPLVEESYRSLLASPVEAGKVLFENQRCDTCHAAGSGQRGPNLVGRFGNYVETQDGQTLLFDEDYVRESILEPRARISRGYEPLMPSYAGQISEEQVLYLVSYIKSLTTETSGGDEE